MLASIILIAGMGFEPDMNLVMGPKACALQRDELFREAFEAHDGKPDTRHYDRECNDDRICRYTPNEQTEQHQGADHD